MEKRRLGKTEMEVSVLGFGGAEIGYENPSGEQIEKLLNNALDAGLNVIDTAECYLDSEEKIGRTIGHRRGEFFLFTKSGHPYGDSPNGSNWTPESILETLERSLRRLQTDHVDLVHLHSCSEEVLRQGDAIAALLKAREKGYTRFIGYSGDSSAARYAIECGQFDTLQTSVNIADQEALELTLPLARERGMGVIAKRPIANAAWRHASRPTDTPYHIPYWQRLQELRYDFLGFPMEEAVGTALRFTLSIPGVHTAIVGTKSPERWMQNAEIVKAGPLPPEQIEAIRARWRETADESWMGQN